MKTKFRKMIAVLLTVTMAFSATTVFAENTPKNIMTDNTINIVTNEAFQDLFAVNRNTRGISDDVTIEKVEYDYAFIKQDENNDLADVTLSFMMTIAGQDYFGSATGTVNAYPLSSGDILWEGPMESNISIDNIVYDILVGFSKLESGDAIQVSVTMQGNNTNPIVFTFGDTILTKEIHDDVMLVAETITLDALNIEDSDVVLTSVNGNNFNTISSKYAQFNSSTGIAGYGQRGIAYLDTTTDEMAIAIKTYENNVETYFENSGFPTTMTESLSYQLTIPSGQGAAHAWIDGTRNYDFGKTSKSVMSAFLNAVFSDAMSALNIPSSTISNLLGSLSGNVVHSYATNVTSIDITMGVTQVAVFDTLVKGVPVIFQLDCTNNYAGGTSYSYSTSVRYRTQLMDYSGTSYQWIYSSANDVNQSGTFSL